MITVVIPAFNEELAISGCLRSLAQQKTRRRFEVVVVDNASTDNTVKHARAFKKHLDLKIISEKEKGRGPARRAGFRKARGRIILSTDADAVLSPHWIETFVTALETGGSIAVTGPCRIDDCDWFTNASVNFLQPFCMHLYRGVFGHYWLTGSNFAIYKRSYHQAGGFSSRHDAMEDIELSFQVSKVGKIRFLGHAPMTSSGRRFRKNLVVGLMSYVQTFARVSVLKKGNATFADVR